MFKDDPAACFVHECPVKTALAALQRRRLWYVLLGAMGGPICGCGAWAAEIPAIGGSATKMTDSLAPLRSSLQLGERNKKSLRGKKVARHSQPGAGAGEPVPLKLTLTLGVSARSPRQQTPGASPTSPIAADAGAGTQASARSARRDDEAPDQPSAPVPFDPTPAGVPPRREPPGADRAASAQGNTVESGLPDLSGETWVMAPIRWRGNTSTSGNLFNDATGSMSTGINNSLQLQTSSYIVAPYIAQWTGTFGLNSSTNSFSSSLAPTTKSEAGSYSFGGNIILLPVSSFPFSANFSRSASESKAAGEKLPSTSTSIGLRQQYRGNGGRDNYTGTYNRTSLVSGQNNGQSSSMQGSYSTQRRFAEDHLLEGQHSINVSLGYSPAGGDGLGQKSRLLNANVSHGWTVHEDLSLSNLVTLSSNRNDVFQGADLTSNESTAFLASSNFSWRPIEDLPVTLTGGASLVQTQTQSQTTAQAAIPAPVAAAAGSNQNSQQSLNAFVSSNYSFNKNFSVSGSGSLSSTSSAGSRFNSAGVGANASYQGDPMSFGAYNYNWGAGGGINSFFASVGGSSVGTSATASHGLVRTVVLDERQSINLNAGQSAGFSQAAGSTSFSLSNSVGASWRASYGDALTANLSGNGGYSISTAQTGNNQSLTASLQGGAAYQVSSRAALTVNANLNWSQSGTGNAQAQPQVLNQLVVDDRQTQLNGSVSLGYNHSSPFSIRNLNYSANVLWVASQAGQRLATPGAPASQTQQTASFQNMLDYRVGRLSFRLSGAIISQGVQQSYSLFGSVNREFDGFFDGRW
jgi:hypothetical protein